MKKILFSSVLSLMILFSFGQSIERQQKQAIRGGFEMGRQSFQSTPSFRNNYDNEIRQKFSVREQNRPQPTKPGSNIIVGPGYYDPWGWGWGWNNRWGLWGAPSFGFNYWSPGFWYDDWGYRQPYRVYHYENGKRDTIKGQKSPLSFGLNFSNQNEVGGFFTVGKKEYFILDFNVKNSQNMSVYYPRLTIDQVIPWNDQKLSDIEEGWSLYLGLGKRFKRTGVHLMLGWVSEDDYFQYFDDTYILSNNGKYSLNNFSRDYLSAKFGLIHDLKRVSLKGDYDPLRKNLTFGVGMNF